MRIAGSNKCLLTSISSTESLKIFWKKKVVAPAVKRELVDYARKQYQASLRMACPAVGISDSVYRYRPDPHRDDEVIAKLQEAANRYPAYRFGKLFKVIRRWGYRWNHKRLYRVYFSLKLNLRRKGKSAYLNEIQRR
ncbi:putative transposase [Vibrio hangzhouensis]|uniref:Putative transposase n=1 Tax=Vibrio hangzhouensis TaxID=462991 RepID=A0A1H6CMR7_9VIBR|nr:putative transposase [Vibrio hangzhouensis]